MARVCRALIFHCSRKRRLKNEQIQRFFESERRKRRSYGEMMLQEEIDHMHNDVKQCFRGSSVHCGSCCPERIQFGVVFFEAENLNGSKGRYTRGDRS